METKTLLKISIIANILLVGLLIFQMFQAPTSQAESEEFINFDDEFFNEVNSQRLTAQNLLIWKGGLKDSLAINTMAYEKTLDKTEKSSKEWTNIKDYLNEYFMADIQTHQLKIEVTPKDCQTIKDKRKFKIELGELIITFKKDKPVSIKGFTITRESADSLLAEIFVYDKALSNICKTLYKLVAPTTSEERQFILDVLDRQQKIVDSYTSFKIAVSKCKSEDEIKKAIEQNKPNTEEIIKEIPS